MFGRHEKERGTRMTKNQDKLEPRPLLHVLLIIIKII